MIMYLKANFKKHNLLVYWMTGKRAEEEEKDLQNLRRGCVEKGIIPIFISFGN